MLIADAQRDMRSAFMGGFVGQLVSGVIWIASAAVSTWVSQPFGMGVLFFGSMLLFPLTQFILRVMGRPAALKPGNTLDQLAMQIAFSVPINFLLVGAATLYQETWFYPASMIVVGAHYLAFVFLYGMKHFGVLAILMVFGGAALGVYGPDMFSLGGWITGVILAVFGFVGRSLILNEERQQMADSR